MKMSKKIFPFAMATLLGVISLSSCQEKSMWTVLPENYSQSDSIVLDTINIFIDASKSMKGYIDAGISSDPDSNAFNLKRVVSTFVTETEKLRPRNFFCYAVKNNKTIPENARDFTKKINDGDLFSDDATLFGKMIATAVEKTCNNGVSIIFTDGIMSYPTAEAYRNVTDIENLKVEVKRAALLARNKGFSVLIVKYDTDFLTRYYANCDNKKPKFFDKEPIMHNRPFYGIMIGADKAISSVYSKVHKTLNGNSGIYFCHSSKAEEYGITTCKEIHAIGIDECDGNTITVNTAMANEFPDATDTIYLGIKTSMFTLSFSDSYLGGCNIKSQNGLITTIKPIIATEMNSGALKPDSVNAIYKMTLASSRSIATSKILDEVIAFVPIQTIDNYRSSVFPDNTDKSSELEHKTFAFRFVLDAFNEVYENNPVAIMRVHFKTN